VSKTLQGHRIKLKRKKEKKRKTKQQNLNTYKSTTSQDNNHQAKFKLMQEKQRMKVSVRHVVCSGMCQAPARD